MTFLTNDEKIEILNLEKEAVEYRISSIQKEIEQNISRDVTPRNKRECESLKELKKTNVERLKTVTDLLKTYQNKVK